MTKPTETFSFASFDGTQIVVDRFGPAVSRPVVLQHGFAATGYSNWVAPGIVRALTNAGRTVLVPDARGHGRSEKPLDPARYGHDLMARDLSALFDDLGVDEVDLGGYSMGGHIALHVLRDDPRIRSAMIAGIGASGIGGRQPRGFDRTVIADALVAYADDPSIRVVDPAAWGFVSFARSTGADVRALAAQMRSANLPVTDLGRVSVPVLVIAGVDDDLARTAEELAAAIAGSTLVRTPGDHLGAVGEPAFIAAATNFFRR